MSQKLDELVLNKGIPVTNEELEKITVSELRMEEINEQVRSVLAYNDNTPIPGEGLDISTEAEFNKETAINSLFQTATAMKAYEKAKAETAEEKAAKEKAANKKHFVEAMLYQQEEMYYQKYHFMMDGPTKRRVRKKIESEYDSGKYSKSYFKSDKAKTVQVKKSKAKTDSKPVSVNDVVSMK